MQYEMSYGWLTEQTIIARQPKKIVVHNESSNIALKSALLSMKAERANAPVTTAVKNKFPKRNAGVQERERKADLTAAVTSLTSEAKQVETALRIKQKLYSQMNDKGANFKQSLVDFSLKKFEGDTEYQQLRGTFYAGKLKQLEDDQKGELRAEEQRDRINWEKKMLDQLVNGQKEQRSKVQQSYDKGMSNEELEALKEVLKEKQKQEQRRDALKRKGQELKEDRIRKLRKLNIIKEDQ